MMPSNLKFDGVCQALLHRQRAKANQREAKQSNSNAKQSKVKAKQRKAKQVVFNAEAESVVSSLSSIQCRS